MPMISVCCRADRRRDHTQIDTVEVNTEGRPEVLGVATGPSKAEPFRKAYQRSLADLRLRGVKLMVAYYHKGLRAAASRVF